MWLLIETVYVKGNILLIETVNVTGNLVTDRDSYVMVEFLHLCLIENDIIKMIQLKMLKGK